MKTDKIFISLMVLIAAGLSISCGLSNSKDITDNREVVKGLYYTDETSPEIIYIFDKPAELVSIEVPMDSISREDPDIPKEFMVQVPYPNPANGNPAISLQVPQRTQVKGWIEEARWKGEEEKEVETPRTLQVVNAELQAGYHRFDPQIQAKCQGGDFEEGFYRVKFQAYDTTLFVDMYLLGYEKNMPDSMQSISNYFGCR